MSHGRAGGVSDLDGLFPFGTPAGRCAPREVRDADAFVLGVYPSALHIRWQGPDPRYRVAALAVAPEPYPFWPGHHEADLVDRWRQALPWRPEWGEALPVGHLNGSSGRVVEDRVLTPLGIDPNRVWFTDALPFFCVHGGEGTQGDAMEKRYDEFARSAGLRPHELPRRPSPRALVHRAIAEERDRLLGELERSGTPLLITLGDEALAVAAALVDGDLPARLARDESYGRRLPAARDGRPLEVLPLVHPGQRGAQWRAAHQRWMDADGAARGRVNRPERGRSAGAGRRWAGRRSRGA